MSLQNQATLLLKLSDPCHNPLEDYGSGGVGVRLGISDLIRHCVYMALQHQHSPMLGSSQMGWGLLLLAAYVPLWGLYQSMHDHA